MPPDNAMPMMGDKVRETVTGKTGIVTGALEYLWGCEQLLVYVDGETDKDGDPKSHWWDISRLVVVERNVAQAVDYSGHGLTPLPATHDDPGKPAAGFFGRYRRGGARRAAFAGAETKPAPRR